MVEGTTKSGFHFVVDPDALQDMEFLDLVDEARTNPSKLGKMFEKLLGIEQKKALYNHVRNEKGMVLIDDVTVESDEIFDILNQSDETKN